MGIDLGGAIIGAVVGGLFAAVVVGIERGTRYLWRLAWKSRTESDETPIDAAAEVETRIRR
jgi:hypothetical protein